MASQIPCIKNGAAGLIFYVGLVSQANALIFQASPTLAAGDVKIALDDAAPGNLATLPVFDADFTKRVKVTLSQAETNADNLTIVFSDASGAEWCDLIINIQTAAQTFDTTDTAVDAAVTDIGAVHTHVNSIVYTVASQVDVNVKSWAGTAVSAPATAGIPEVNLKNIANAAVSVTTAQLGVNVVNIGGTAQTANDNGADINDILIDTATIDTAGEIAAAVWSADATTYQTQGTFGQAIGDPVADTNTIFKAVVTDATGATVGVDVVAVKAELTDIHGTDLPAVKTDTAAILIDTAVIGALGAGLTAVASAANLADLHTDVGTAITDIAAVHVHAGTIETDVAATHVHAAGGETQATAAVAAIGTIVNTGGTATIGAIMGDLANSAVVTRIAALKAETALIVADTGELQTDWANGGRLDLILDAAGGAADPLLNPVPGAYAAGTAGFIIGTNLDDKVSNAGGGTGSSEIRL